MEYATSGGRKLHELSYIFVTSAIYSATARVCRDLSGEVREWGVWLCARAWEWVRVPRGVVWLR